MSEASGVKRKGNEGPTAEDELEVLGGNEGSSSAKKSKHNDDEKEDEMEDIHAPHSVVGEREEEEEAESSETGEHIDDVMADADPQAQENHHEQQQIMQSNVVQQFGAPEPPAVPVEEEVMQPHDIPAIHIRVHSPGPAPETPQQQGGELPPAPPALPAQDSVPQVENIVVQPLGAPEPAPIPVEQGTGPAPEAPQQQPQELPHMHIPQALPAQGGDPQVEQGPQGEAEPQGGEVLQGEPAAHVVQEGEAAVAPLAAPHQEQQPQHQQHAQGEHADAQVEGGQEPVILQAQPEQQPQVPVQGELDHVEAQGPVLQQAQPALQLVPQDQQPQIPAPAEPEPEEAQVEEGQQQGVPQAQPAAPQVFGFGVFVANGNAFAALPQGGNVAGGGWGQIDAAALPPAALVPFGAPVQQALVPFGAAQPPPAQAQIVAQQHQHQQQQPQAPPQGLEEGANEGGEAEQGEGGDQAAEPAVVPQAQQGFVLVIQMDTTLYRSVDGGVPTELFTGFLRVRRPEGVEQGGRQMVLFQTNLTWMRTWALAPGHFWAVANDNSPRYIQLRVLEAGAGGAEVFNDYLLKIPPEGREALLAQFTAAHVM